MSQLRAREGVDELRRGVHRTARGSALAYVFFEDGQPMVIYANFSGIQASLAERALAKVTTFRFSGLRNLETFSTLQVIA